MIKKGKNIKKLAKSIEMQDIMRSEKPLVETFNDLHDSNKVGGIFINDHKYLIHTFSIPNGLHSLKSESSKNPKNFEGSLLISTKKQFKADQSTSLRLKRLRDIHSHSETNSLLYTKDKISSNNCNNEGNIAKEQINSKIIQKECKSIQSTQFEFDIKHDKYMNRNNKLIASILKEENEELLDKRKHIEEILNANNIPRTQVN